METSPLILAQSHARNALSAPNATAASDEHDLAASQFATAAKETANPEAFRTLKLLEQHHEHLAQLLKFQNTHPIADVPSEPKITPPALPPPPPRAIENSPYRAQPPNPPLTHIPQRDISSSIASNLASARGIPSNRQRRSSPASPLLPQQSDNKFQPPPKKSKLGESTPKATHGSSLDRRQDTRNHNSPPSLSSKSSTASSSQTTPKQVDADSPANNRSDEPFQRFYATFESLFSKLSAPLAFAGLPLHLDEPPPPPPNAYLKPTSVAKPKTDEQRLPATDPDLSKIFSKAALRALRDENGGPASGGPFGGAESFYVVPTTGGTISYADILARAQQESMRHGSTADPNASNHPDENNQLEDEFVDARETPQPASPVISRRSQKPGTKTMEELQLENEALRTLADHVSRRLLEFEMGAQTSSLALQRSIRAMQSQSPPVGAVAIPESSNGAGHSTDSAKAKAVVLEEKVAELKREAERMGRENEKLRGVVGRYRERWEKLKEGARVRREGTGDGVG